MTSITDELYPKVVKIIRKLPLSREQYMTAQQEVKSTFHESQKNPITEHLRKELYERIWEWSRTNPDIRTLKAFADWLETNDPSFYQAVKEVTDMSDEFYLFVMEKAQEDEKGSSNETTLVRGLDDIIFDWYERDGGLHHLKSCDIKIKYPDFRDYLRNREPRLLTEYSETEILRAFHETITMLDDVDDEWFQERLTGYVSIWNSHGIPFMIVPFTEFVKGDSNGRLLYLQNQRCQRTTLLANAN